MELAGDLYARGLTDFLAVLDAQRRLYDSEDAAARARAEVAQQLVALFKSLGGGWNIAEAEGTAVARKSNAP